ncbi:MAG TPA: hypothetical protein VN455_02210 [Methanotrichaceae archaeon]|nr:hypothetical protein [Methanotrichaceae archaeon]
MPDSSDHDILIALGKDVGYIRQEIDNVRSDISDICNRMDNVEKTAAAFEDYRDFQKDVYDHFEKYDAACVNAASCPKKLEEFGSRIKCLEDVRAQNDGCEKAQVDMLAKWGPVVAPIISGLIVGGLMLLGQMWIHMQK